MSHSRISVTLSALLAFSAISCGGSSSETPPPVEPIEQRLRMNEEGSADAAAAPTPTGDYSAPTPTGASEETQPAPPPEGIAPVAPL